MGFLHGAIDLDCYFWRFRLLLLLIFFDLLHHIDFGRFRSPRIYLHLLKPFSLSMLWDKHCHVGIGCLSQILGRKLFIIVIVLRCLCLSPDFIGFVFKSEIIDFIGFSFLGPCSFLERLSTGGFSFGFDLILV